jgi:hypothetical protein
MRHSEYNANVALAAIRQMPRAPLADYRSEPTKRTLLAYAVLAFPVVYFSIIGFVSCFANLG